MSDALVLIDAIKDLGAVGILVGLGIAHFRGIIRWGKDCDKLEKIVEEYHASTAKKLEKFEDDVYFRGRGAK
jgi:hypothetical protein